jgi:glutaredoxin-related protein
MIVSAGQSAVADHTVFSSDSCAFIDKKIMELDRFTTMVNNTSAFHLAEKASALSVPGITVSNNKRHMLRDAKKKYAEYAEERQKYDCETTVAAPGSSALIASDISANRATVPDHTVFSSDSCTFIDKKIMELDRFTTMVNNTSAFHLAEKASALPVPGITVSNNKRQMLRDAKKKYAEYAAERQKYDCETAVAARTQAVDKKAVVSSSATIDKKNIKTDAPVHKVYSSSVVHTEVKAKPQRHVVKTPMPTQSSEKKAVVNKHVVSSDTSDTCAAIIKKIIRLDEFTTMVNNTSAFHLEEKAAALLVPGITVSNNKKKMLRIAKKKDLELLKEYQKYGCGISKK